MRPPQRYARYISLFDDAMLADLLRPGFSSASEGGRPADLAAIYESLRASAAIPGLPHRDDVQAALATDRVTYLPGDLLTKVDRASMLHALEVRSPFMDPDLVRFAAALSTDSLLRGGPKRLLREAFAHELPGTVYTRKKMGFGVPIGDWFRGDLRDMLFGGLLANDAFAATHFRRPVIERMLEEHDQYYADHSQRLYALLMLELWWKTTQ